MRTVRPVVASRRACIQVHARRAIVLRATLALLAGCALSACGDAPRRPANVILVSVDTLRPDHLSAYGYGRATSPFLDSLAARGVRFDAAFAQTSWTLPSHMSLLTSCYPHTHQVQNPNRSLPPSIPLLAERLDEAGYVTASFVSWIFLEGKFGFDRGVDHFRELLPPKRLQDRTTEHAIRADQVVDEIVAWAATPPEGPFFLFVHLFDPHLSYAPALDVAQLFDANIASIEDGAYDHVKQYIRGLNASAPRVPADELERALVLYDGEIRATDDALRRMFDALDGAGMLDNTLVAFTSDHGEEFDDHGSMEGHQWTLYDEVLRVPLILVLPDGARSGTTVPQMVQSIDVAPTILDVLGLEPPATFEGRSLLPLMHGDAANWDEYALASVRRFNLKWSLRTPEHKLIFTGDTETNHFGVPVRTGFELYDLERDPGETTDLHGVEKVAGLPALKQRLRAFIEAAAAEIDVQKPDLNKEELERLKAIGY